MFCSIVLVLNASHCEPLLGGVAIRAAAPRRLASIAASLALLALTDVEIERAGLPTRALHRLDVRLRLHPDPLPEGEGVYQWG